MGNFFTRATHVDSLTLTLNTQRGSLVQHQQQLEVVIQKEQDAARELVRRRKNTAALLALKKKKVHEKLLKEVKEWLVNVEKQLSDIQIANQKAIKDLQSEINLDDVQKLMDETPEAKAYQDEANAILAQKHSLDDEGAVLAELADIKMKMGTLEVPEMVDRPAKKCKQTQVLLEKNVPIAEPASYPQRAVTDSIEDFEMVELPDIPATVPTLLASQEAVPSQCENCGDPTKNYGDSTLMDFDCGKWVEEYLAEMAAPITLRSGQTDSQAQGRWSSILNDFESFTWEGLNEVLVSNAVTAPDNILQPLQSQVLPLSSGGKSVELFECTLLKCFNNDVQEASPVWNPKQAVDEPMCDGVATKKIQKSNSLPFQVRKEGITSFREIKKNHAGERKVGEKISNLQQLVAPFGKSDTASVLLEAIGYIMFLHEKIEMFSSPDMKRNINGPTNLSDQKHETFGSSSCEKEGKDDLRSRGLCLVPTLQLLTE